MRQQVRDVTLHVHDVLQRARDGGVIRVLQCVRDGDMTREPSRVLIGCDFDTE